MPPPPIAPIETLTLTAATTNTTPTFPAPSNPMRIFVVQSAPGLTPSSGGHKANMCLATSLARRGHRVRMLIYCWRNELSGVPNVTEEWVQWKSETKEEGGMMGRVYRFEWEGEPRLDVVAIELDDYWKVYAKEGMHEPNMEEDCKRRVVRLKEWLEDLSTPDEYMRYARFMTSELLSFCATHFLFNESTSLKIAAAFPSTLLPLTRIFICHACEHLPFGPYAGIPGFGTAGTHIEHLRLEKVECAWAVSRAMLRYVEDHGDGRVRGSYMPLHPRVFGEEWRRHENFDAPMIVAINPGTVKGFEIVRDVARRMPDMKFGCVKSWNLSEWQVGELEKLENVRLLPTFSNMEELWPQVKILLAPSLWFEAFGIVIVEAQLRGIPVLCSDVGGMPEAKCGITEGIIPVNGITGLDRESDEEEVKKFGPYKVPPQDSTSWIHHIRRLCNSRVQYEHASLTALSASRDWVRSIDEGAYEQWFADLHEERIGAMEEEQRVASFAVTQMAKRDKEGVAVLERSRTDRKGNWWPGRHEGKGWKGANMI